jgi:hypothetical protein
LIKIANATKKLQILVNSFSKKNLPGQNETIIIQAKANPDSATSTEKNPHPQAQFNCVNQTNTSLPSQIINSSALSETFKVNADQSLDISLDLNIDLPMELTDVIVSPNVVVQQTTTNNASMPLDLMTFDSSRGYMRINSDQPLIPTDTLNTQNLYNLLVKLQQTNKLELNNDSLTSQFYISSQELSSLLEPNQNITTHGDNLLGGSVEVATAQVSNGSVEPNNNNHNRVNQNMFTPGAVNDTTPIYYMETSGQANFYPINENTSTQQEQIYVSSNQTGGGSNSIPVNSGCQEMCCLLKFNALIDHGNQLF